MALLIDLHLIEVGRCNRANERCKPIPAVDWDVEYYPILIQSINDKRSIPGIVELL